MYLHLYIFLRIRKKLATMLPINKQTNKKKIFFFEKSVAQEVWCAAFCAVHLLSLSFLYLTRPLFATIVTKVSLPSFFGFREPRVPLPQRRLIEVSHNNFLQYSVFLNGEPQVCSHLVLSCVIWLFSQTLQWEEVVREPQRSCQRPVSQRRFCIYQIHVFFLK